ncbi:hypothetical protein ACYVU7_05250 [Arenicellales bacterium IMCC56312]
MTLLIRLLSVLVISTSLFVAGCSSGGSSAGYDKEDTDGDGIADIYDPDIDGDGIPNGQDPDIDGDGIPNDQDPDMDGDGKPNGKDPDPENNDPNYCDRIQVFGLNDEQKIGTEIELTWGFFNSKVGIIGECTLKDGVEAGLVRFTASAAGAIKTRSGKTNPLDEDDPKATIKIPVACTGDTVEVTYDFTEFATLIKADPNAPGWTVKQPHKADHEACDTDGDGSPDFGLQCPYDATGTYPNCSCPGEDINYDGATNSCIKDCYGAYLELTDSQLEVSGTPWGCAFTAAQSELELGVEWRVKVQYTEPNDPDYFLATDAGPVLTLKGKVSSFPLSYDSCEGIDLSKLENIVGTVTKTKVKYDQVKYLEDAASAVDFYVTPTNGQNVPQIDIKDCALQAGDLLPPGSTASASDTDNDGIPNDADPDVDGDGTPNTSDKDIDGDGIWNKDDPDIDGDGKTNGIDPDADGDGTPDAEDDTPGGPQ